MRFPAGNRNEGRAIRTSRPIRLMTTAHCLAAAGSVQPGRRRRATAVNTGFVYWMTVAVGERQVYHGVEERS